MSIGLIDVTKEEACRTAEANTIRAKTGGSTQIAYDFANNRGFADAIAAIPMGGGGITAGIRFDVVNAQGDPTEITIIGNVIPLSCCNGWTQLTKAVVPSGITTIATSAFARTALTSVTIPDSVVSILAYAFQNITALTSLTLGSSVAAINTSAFAGCTGLRTVTIPASCTTIQGSAFQNVPFTEVHFLGSTPPTLQHVNAFSGCTSSTVFYVPDAAAKAAYQAASNWSSLSVTWEVEPT